MNINRDYDGLFFYLRVEEVSYFYSQPPAKPKSHIFIT